MTPNEQRAHDMAVAYASLLCRKMDTEDPKDGLELNALERFTTAYQKSYNEFLSVLDHGDC
jgi:hypothetical protein